MALVTDWYIKLLNGVYDVTNKCEWGVDVQETLGQPATASFTLQDRFMGDYDFQDLAGGFDIEEIDVKIGLNGVDVPIFRGKALRDAVTLPEQFPWRFHKMDATDYQREIFDRRLVGVPDGFMWSGPDSDGNYVPDDPASHVGVGGTDRGEIQSLFAAYVGIPPALLDVDTFVYEYTDLTGAPYLADRATVRQVMEWLAGQVSGNLQYWLDPALRLHWQTIPRWFELISLATGISLPRMMPSAPFPQEQAPVNIDNNGDADGIEAVGCRNLSWNFDYGNITHQFYVTGGTGYAYNGGLVDRGGTGWVSFGGDNDPSKSRAQALLDAPEAIDKPGRMAAAARADKATDRGVLRGSLTLGGPDDASPDGLHVGQAMQIRDNRMPVKLRDKYFTIQRVTTKLIPFVNKRIYSIEWGDAPTARTSSRRPRERDASLRSPGRLWDIATRNQQPLPGSTMTVVGQLTDDAGNASRVYGVIAKLELHVWDANGDPVTGVGSITPDTAVTDSMGRWQTDLTVGSQAGYWYCICPVGSNSCHLP